MDGYLKQNLDRAKEIVTKDWDFVCFIDGYEGSGKSVIAQQVAKYCDPTFNIDRICFNPDDFIKRINEAKKGEAIILDEAYGAMSARAAMSSLNRTMLAVLMEIRQKNLFVFIVCPCFMDVEKYVAIWRSRALIHVYTKNFKRGTFAFFNADRKKTLYVLGKKYYSYSKPKANFIGSFTDGYVVDDVEYRKKKLQALEHRQDENKKQEPSSKFKDRFYLLVAKLNRVYRFETDHLARMTDLNVRTIQGIVKKSRDKDAEVGNSTKTLEKPDISDEIGPALT